MDKKHIGFIFSYDENWVGGSYYILNIIKALKTLPVKEQPKVSILSAKQDDYDLVKNETKYVNLEYLNFPKNPSFVRRLVNRIYRLFTNRDSSLVKTKLKGIDFVYPNYSDSINNVSIPKVYWIPDFQEVYLPHFFTEKVKDWRSKHQKKLVENADLVVFSSQDALSHFNTMYPNYHKLTSVLPFAVSHPSLDNLNFKEVQKKYDLPDKFYFSPNQFWIHKNHFTALRALKILKDQGVDLMIVFSGKEYDYRSPDYFDSLKEYVSKNKLQENVRFLGFIDRIDQLLILKNSIAVVQPSLFEGWSTAVEDAKAQNKLLILSDLVVHREQLEGRSAMFFDAEDSLMLSELLKKTWNEVPMEVKEKKYQDDIEVFGRKFIELASSVKR